MYTLSTRTLSALAYERGEEYDPSLPPVTPSEIEALALLETARPVDRRARRLRAPPSGAQRERQRAKRELNGIPRCWWRRIAPKPWHSYGAVGFRLGCAHRGTSGGSCPGAWLSRRGFLLAWPSPCWR